MRHSSRLSKTNIIAFFTSTGSQKFAYLRQFEKIENRKIVRSSKTNWRYQWFYFKNEKAIKFRFFYYKKKWYKWVSNIVIFWAKFELSKNFLSDFDTKFILDQFWDVINDYALIFRKIKQRKTKTSIFARSKGLFWNFVNWRFFLVFLFLNVTGSKKFLYKSCSSDWSTS